MATNQVLFQYLSPGSHRVTVPAGFSNQLLVYAWGAGGGAGARHSGANGQLGGGAGFAQGIVTISSGDVITVSVGTRGQNGRAGTGTTSLGGDGTNPIISFTGGSAGASNSYDEGYNGAGGGGGGASAVLIGSVPMIVAAGGGGAGGGASYQLGAVGYAGGVATSVTSIPRGQNSTTAYATGGGGGAGYPFGGSAGLSVADDVGAPGGGYGGQNYANALVASSTLTAGSNTTPGGLTNAVYPRGKKGYAGYDGAIILIFTKNFQTWIKDSTWKEVTNAWVKTSGLWKQITAGWIKADGVWEPIQSGVNLTPTRTATLPASPVQVNITIAASANNYVLSDYLSATSYYPGRSNIALTVNSNVIVSSSSSGQSALLVNGLTAGDTVWLINNGTVQGRGGDGGPAGSYTSTGGTELDSKGRPVYGTSKGRTVRTTSIPGRPGASGGTALDIAYPIKLVNNNIIAGGGGGGGGGGGPTGGQGGGGAGYGAGANNGTVSAAGAGAGLGGAGGARGSAGIAGTADTNPGGVGGLAGPAINGNDNVVIITEGTIAGPRRAGTAYVDPHSI